MNSVVPALPWRARLEGARAQRARPYERVDACTSHSDLPQFPNDTRGVMKLKTRSVVDVFIASNALARSSFCAEEWNARASCVNTTSARLG
jgi:hypothetical protein